MWYNTMGDFTVVPYTVLICADGQFPDVAMATHHLFSDRRHVRTSNVHTSACKINKPGEETAIAEKSTNNTMLRSNRH